MIVDLGSSVGFILVVLGVIGAMVVLGKLSSLICIGIGLGFSIMAWTLDRLTYWVACRSGAVVEDGGGESLDEGHWFYPWFVRSLALIRRFDRERDLFLFRV